MEDYPYRDETFKTGTGLFEPDEPEPLRLPEAVNFVALRETCLSEAPFVTKSNRVFWKKWMDSSQYLTILAASLKLVMSCIDDLGSVNTFILYNLDGNPLMEQMSVCIAEMLVMDRSKFSRSHDTLFRRLPELLCYMIIGSLHSCAGKQGRVYNSVKFREVLLDWVGELIGGLRITNCMKDREWLFMDANEVSVLVTHVPPPGYQQSTGSGGAAASTTNTPRRRRGVGDSNSAHDSSSLADSVGSDSQLTPRSATGKSSIVNKINKNGGLAGMLKGSSSLTKLPTVKNGAKQNGNGSKWQHRENKNGKNNIPIANKGAAVSTFTIENSPLVKMYMNLGRNTQDSGYLCAHPCKVLLSHLPERPLAQMQPQSLLLPGQFREKKISHDQFQDTLKNSNMKRRQILSSHQDHRRTLKHELSRTSEAYKVQLALLDKKPVTQKQLLLAAAAATATKDSHNQYGNPGSPLSPDEDM